MKKFTIKEYANKHKLSIFNVMKMVKAGSVKTQTELEDNREVIYIIEDAAQQKEIAGKIIKPALKDQDIPGEIKCLKKELHALREEIEHLKAQLTSK